MPDDLPSEEIPSEPSPATEGTSLPGPPGVLEKALVVVSVALWPLAAMHRIVNTDLWWHLTAARWILDNGSVPTEEFASWTARGTDWFDYEWLWQLAVYGLWEIGGPALLVCSTALLSAFTGYLLYRAIRAAGAEPALAAALLWPAVFTAGPRLQTRPEMVTHVFVALTLWLLLRYRNTGASRALWVLVPVTALWANLHPGFLFGLGLIGFLGIGEAVDAWRVRADQDRRARRFGRFLWLLRVGVACGLASLLTPRPFGPHLLVLESLVSFRAIGFRNLEWTPMPFSAEALPFWVLLLGTALLLLASPHRRTAEWLWLGVYGLLAVQTQRSAALLALVAPPIAAASLRRLQPRPLGRFPDHEPARARRAAFLVMAGLLLAGVLLLPAALRSRIARPGLDVEWSTLPVEASSFIAREELLGRMFNDYRFGGYLGYRFALERPVFADGKHIPYVEMLGRMEEAMQQGYPAFQSFLEEGPVEYAVLHYDHPLQNVHYAPDPDTGETKSGRRAWSTVWFHRSDWALVYWDDTAMVKVRRRGGNLHVAERFEYEHVDPEDWRHQLQEVLEGRLDAGPILDDLERKRSEDPGCNLARFLYEEFSRAAGEADAPLIQSRLPRPSSSAGPRAASSTRRSP